MEKTLQPLENDKNGQGEAVQAAPNYLAQHFFLIVKGALLFLILSLPAVTVFAAWNGLLSICGKVRKGQPVFLWSDFWETFTRGFGKATWLGILLVAGLGLQAVAYVVYLRLLEVSFLVMVPLAALFFVSLIYLASGAICFVKLSQNPGRKLKPLMKTSVKQAVWQIQKSVFFLLGLAASAVLAVISYPYSLIVLPVALPFLLGILCVVLFDEKAQEHSD